MSSQIIKGEDLCFSEKGVLEVVRNVFLRLWNVYRFFITYSNLDKWQPKNYSPNNLVVLDKWILFCLDEICLKITESLERYDISKALSYVSPFVNDLSTWYIRRSRDRVGPTAPNGNDKDICHATLHQVLVILSRLLAPFTPFIAEEIYKNLTGKESVHLSDWPKVKPSDIKTSDKKLFKDMQLVRQICELGHSARKQENIKVRQPLAKLKVKSSKLEALKKDKQLIQLIKDELNIKEVVFFTGKELEIELDFKITPELKKEGEARELIRQFQEARKKAECRLDQLVLAYAPDWPKKHEQEIMKKALLKSLKKGNKVKIVK